MGKCKLIMDVGSKFTKIGLVQRAKKGYMISKATYIYTPVDYNFRDKMWLEQIKLKLEEMKVRGNSLYVLLTKDNINVQVDEDTIQKVKNMSAKNLTAGIVNKINNAVQDKDITVTDWDIVRQDDSSVTFLYTVIKRDLVDMFATVAEQCKLKLVSIGVRTNALINLVKVYRKMGKFEEQGEDDAYCLC